MVEKIPVVCSRPGCGREQLRHRRSITSEVPFVCKFCRCIDCQIVFDLECDCGEYHGDRSFDDPRVCVVCIQIRERVKNLDNDQQQMRSTDFKNEEPFWS